MSAARAKPTPNSSWTRSSGGSPERTPLIGHKTQHTENEPHRGARATAARLSSGVRDCHFGEMAIGAYDPFVAPERPDEGVPAYRQGRSREADCSNHRSEERRVGKEGRSR